MISNHNLQYVIACLSTHSGWVKKFMKNFDVLDKHFNLKLDDRLLLDEFILKQGGKFLASSLIMEEKRWREVLLALKYIPKILGENLRYWWLNYIDSFKITDHIPKTPIDESISFISFLLENASLNRISYLIAVYELKRNIALAYNFNLTNVKNEVDFIHKDILATTGYLTHLNPSLTVERFDCSISKLALILKNNSSIDLNSLSIDCKDEYIGFYKNRTTNMVCVFVICETLKLIISKILIENNIQKLLILLSDKCNIHVNKLTFLLKLLNKNGIIFFNRIITE